ncbi:hypothetical protein CRM22_006781 [Opisthorchis felineus]|uniref:Uncharacterized protein n=1 Tax=Opisthorchis felineus TaxID=147828 RepID=A0A4S2LJA4_OPIFE|nr:hypothetical protein CRM22_006781 [Opisthorchis felineus]
MIVLQMVRNRTTRYETFVDNRLASILDYSEAEDWMYVESKRNPADIASSGPQSDISKLSLWLSGPKFLRKDCNEWPPRPVSYPIPVLHVKSKETEVVHATSTYASWIGRFEHVYSWSLIKRLVAWLRRFCLRMRRRRSMPPGDELCGRLTRTELVEAERLILSLLDDSAARQLLSTGTSIEVPPAALWEISDDLFKARQPTLLQLERLRERKQLPGESVDQFVVSLRTLATKIYAPEDRVKTEEELLQQFILGVSHPGLKAELICRSPDNIRDAIQLGRSYEAASALEPQLHALKLTTTSSPRQPSPRSWNNRSASRMNCPYCRRFGRRAQRCGHNPPIRPTGEPLTFCNSVPVISHISHSMPPLTMSGYLDNRPVRFLVDTGTSCSVVGAREFWPRGRQPAASTKLITANGAPLQTARTASFSVSIGQLCTHRQFYCAPVTWEAILGMDFLKKYKASIDLAGAELNQNLQQMTQETVSKAILQRGCDRIFTTPKANHRGGIWERMIRSIRRILRSLLGDQLITDEVLTTVLTEVEKQ